MADVRVQQTSCDAPHFRRHPLIGRRYDYLTCKAAIGQCHRDRQAVGDLMNLVVVEKKCDAHVAMTPPQ